MFDVKPLSTQACKLLAYVILASDANCQVKRLLADLADDTGIGRTHIGKCVAELVEGEFIEVLEDGRKNRKPSTFQVLCVECTQEPPDEVLETFVREHGYAELDIQSQDDVVSHMGFAQPMERNNAPVRVQPVVTTNWRECIRGTREPRS